MINYTNIKDSNDRLNLILDKISSMGIKKITKEETDFLESYSKGIEEELNKRMTEEENEKTFISDDGNFMFKFDFIEVEDEEVKYINGTFIVPDIKKNKKIVKGELKGCIILFNDKTIAIDFNSGKYDIFEFVSGLEYELDCFVDDIVYRVTG